MTTDSLETKTTAPSNSASPKPAPRPQLGLRIGVTGHRSLNADLRAQVQKVLALVGQDMKDLAREQAVANFYAAGAPMMRVISPLASGADRLVAEVGLDLGYTLYVPMPFARDQYETDFKHPEASAPATDDDDLGRFEKLFERAGEEWLALDGDPDGRNRAYGYENVGRFVVRHSDVLIALWDGQPAVGRGGTAEIIYYAATNGVPVWWIHATDASKPPVWIADVQDLRDPLPPTESPEDQLKSYLSRQIRPPGPIRTRSHSLFEMLAHLGRNADVAPESEYYAEQPRPVARYWRVYNGLMRWASGCNPPWTQHAGRETRWRPIGLTSTSRPMNARENTQSATVRPMSGFSSWPHRPCCSASLALCCMLYLTGHQASPAFFWVFLEKAAVFFWTFLELVLLVSILGLVGIALRSDWHRRSIEYRLLAELCRKQQVLAPLGNAVSLGAVRHIVNRLDSDLGRMKSTGKASSSAGPQTANELPLAGGPDHAAWVAWLFAACQRAAPLPRGEVEKLLPEAVDKGLVEGLLEEQLQYHQGRCQMAGEASNTFEFFGVLTFSRHRLGRLEAVRDLAKLGFFPGTALRFPFGIAFAAVSAAFVGIRSYAELQLLAEQSHHMLDELGQAKARLERIRKDVPRPMAFHDLGAEAQIIAISTLAGSRGMGAPVPRQSDRTLAAGDLFTISARRIFASRPGPGRRQHYLARASSEGRDDLRKPRASSLPALRQAWRISDRLCAVVSAIQGSPILASALGRNFVASPSSPAITASSTSVA